MTVLREPDRKITRRHRHDWRVPVGEVPRLFGLDGTASCSKCGMRVTTDDALFDPLLAGRLNRMATGYFG